MGYEMRHHKLKPHRHLAQRRPNRDDVGPPPLGYPPPPQQQLAAAVPYCYSMAPALTYAPPVLSPQQEHQLQQALADARRHGRNQHVGEVAAVTAGAFALYELHEAKVDPAHARRHKCEAKLAGAVAVGSANYAYHEHKEKKKSEQIVEMLGGGGRNTAPTGNKIKDSLLTFASGGHKHDPKKEKPNFLRILSGDAEQRPSKDQKPKHHHRLW